MILTISNSFTFFLSSTFISLKLLKLLFQYKNKKKVLVSKYGYILDHPEEHISQDILEKMRYDIDNDGDEFLEGLIEFNPLFLTCKPFKIHDLLKEVLVIYSQMKNTQQSNESENNNNTTSNTNNTSNNNNNSSKVLSTKIIKYLDKYSKSPDWIDWNRIEHGQCVYLRYSTIATMALTYYSLIGGFAAPKIIKVLNSTGYLSRNTEGTYRRLNETFDMIIKCLDGPNSLKFNHDGWLSITSVRLLHSRVRYRLLNNGNNNNNNNNNNTIKWNHELYGLPINQEDMMGTLLSFSINVIVSFHRANVPYLTKDDELSYLHLWRYIGYLIGVKDIYNPLTSLSRAHGAIQSIVTHLLHPDNTSEQIAKHIIKSISNRKPYPFSTLTHSEAARYFLGHDLPNALKLESSLFHRLYFHSIILFIQIIYYYVYSLPLLSSYGLIPFHSDYLLSSLSNKSLQRNLERLKKSLHTALVEYSNENEYDKLDQENLLKQQNEQREQQEQQEEVANIITENDSCCPFHFMNQT